MKTLILIAALATIELEDVASAGTGSLVVIVKKAPTPDTPAPGDACALANLAIPAICQLSPPRHCT